MSSLKILPLASESLGARSMATFVKTPDVSILIDPGIAIPPKRMKLPAHPVEIKNLKERWQKIVETLKISQMVVITHYHYDHFNPDQVWYYKGKTVFLKNPDEKTNTSQKRRGNNFLNLIKDFVSKIYFADNLNYEIGKTSIIFSNPVYHGPFGKMGYVIQVFINYRDEGFLFTSDIQGPFQDEQMDFIMKYRPDIIYIDPPPVYLLKQSYPLREFENSLDNLKLLVDSPWLKTLIIDHHPLRTSDWRDYFGEIIKNPKVKTAASYIGEKEKLLEANRRSLYFGV